MVTHSSLLIWRVSRTEKPGRLQSGVAESDVARHTEHAVPRCILTRVSCLA